MIYYIPQIVVPPQVGTIDEMENLKIR